MKYRYFMDATKLALLNATFLCVFITLIFILFFFLTTFVFVCFLSHPFLISLTLLLFPRSHPLLSSLSLPSSVQQKYTRM